MPTGSTWANTVVRHGARRAYWPGFVFFAALMGSGSILAQTAGTFDNQVAPILKRCLGCHNDQVKSSGLSLLSREAVLAGGTRGPSLVPGKPEDSVIVQAVRQTGPLKMPPGGKLSAEEVDTLSRWIGEGAPWGASLGASSVPRSTHWAFQPIRRPAAPRVRQTEWVRNTIDSFVLSKLEAASIRPSPEANRNTLIRRVYLDLTGLLPTPQEVEEFKADMRPDAYQRLVERLLASPHYGERWGRHWLDLARYADSDGYVADGARPIWRYRDWVISSLNRDQPFDQFVIDQIAGDLLPNPTTEQLVATGFHRNTMINLEGGVDYEQYRVEAVVDRVATTGSVFLGLTLGCARCHDHKFDPISQREFYQMYAFFNNVDELTRSDQDVAEEDQNNVLDRRARSLAPILEFGTPEQYTQRAELRKKMQELRGEIAAYEITLSERYRNGDLRITDAQRAKLSEVAVKALALRPQEWSRFEAVAVQRAFREWDAEYRRRETAIRALQRQEPNIPSTLVMRELPKSRPAFVHLSGDFTRKGIDVQPGVPSVLPALKAQGAVATRLDLAKWLVSPENPLTSRVTVNQIWQHYFGRGLVYTEEDFGNQGTPPSHPELLDWLAGEFVENGWSRKAIHRLIVNSAAYRQSSTYREDLSQSDPDNRLLARQTRLRLEAEIVRDVALSASGMLTPKVGGPSVFPPQPRGIEPSRSNPNFWVTEKGENRYRRGMYTHFWRSTPHPVLGAFDAPSATMSCTRRTRSNTPLQALHLLNDEAFYEFAQGLAGRVLREASTNSDRLRLAFALCASRLPTSDEAAKLQTFLASQLDSFQSQPQLATAIAGDKPNAPELAAWIAVSRVLLNIDEVITRE